MSGHKQEQRLHLFISKESLGRILGLIEIMLDYNSSIFVLILQSKVNFYEIVEEEIIFTNMLFLPRILEAAYWRNFSLPNARSNV